MFTTALLGAAFLCYGAEESRRLHAERRAEHRLYLTRPEIMRNPRENTPWQVLYHSQSDRAFIITMGLDVPSFDLILEAGFQRRWDSLPIPRRDVNSCAKPRIFRRSLDAAGGLGLVLHFLNSTMLETSLVQIFALVPSTVSRYISFSLSILLLTLREMHHARIRWLEGDEFEQRCDLVCKRHPVLTGAFGIMDGLNLPVQTSSDQHIENATFNGWLHDHFVKCVIAFCSQGEIIGCRLNCPGSWHDSRVAFPIYEKLRTSTPEGYYLVTDTAFPRGTQQTAGHIKAPMKDGTRLPLNPRLHSEAMIFDRQLLSFRQAAEWGMGALQGSFGRLRVPLPINYEDHRGDLLENCMRLFNLRTRLVGYNQIRSVYLPIWKEGEYDRVWNSFEDMLFKDQRKSDRVSRFHLAIEYE
ncbi:hypothetical protein M378DRAFT_89013 [Amanita muscaria Koide BX008]|uniref:DDE Tnp4 domain-containing protein n=1 Tax=Amanita muscaria (strain Koide BX008) TaxID=946122 RepID=A0A0C2WKG9_AMAMK|nr:hypothetical protein M378DRAFT_89013 [Amanita muscaria Koide BX008]